MINYVQFLKKFHGEVTEDVVNFKEILSGYHNLVAIDTVEKIGVRWQVNLRMDLAGKEEKVVMPGNKNNRDCNDQSEHSCDKRSEQRLNRC